MHATLALSPLLAACVFGVHTPSDDDYGAHPWGNGWVVYGRHEIGQPNQPVSDKSGSDGSLIKCHTIGGENGISYLQCKRGPDGQRNVFQGITPGDPAAPAVTPEMLLQQAVRQLTPPAPQVATAPPRGKDGLVGLPHFFWVERSQWHPISKRVTSGPVWAEATATPTALVISPGAGQTEFVCSGPGKPYDRRELASRQKSDCAYLFTRSSARLPGSHYRVTVTIRWTATWTGSGGAGGTLAPRTTSTTFPLRIAEGQALIQRSS
ncbi:hypothetical protein [Sphaerimonospora mesophila]|uniref:hypothetical protein n=1 Tax=Sphaerimonospora mesophila TaxID=37483 RepID=UPI0006E3480B